MRSINLGSAKAPISEETLRDFAWILAGALAVGSLWLSTRESDDLRPPSLLLGLIILLVAWLKPGLLRGPYRLWMTVGGWLGFINTRILLVLIYFLVFTPLGLIRRALGKDDLERRFAPEAESYLRRTTETTNPQYARQF